MKSNKSKQTPANTTSDLGGKLKRKNALKFIAIFSAVLGGYYLSATYLLRDNLFDWYVKVTAYLSSFLLMPFDSSVTSSGEVISGAKYAVSVSFGCDGSEPIALFAAAVSAFPLPVKTRIKGLCAGGAILYALNLVRIAALFLIGSADEDLMKTFHIEIFPIMFILFAIVIWAIWINRSLKLTKRSKDISTEDHCSNS